MLLFFFVGAIGGLIYFQLSIPVDQVKEDIHLPPIEGEEDKEADEVEKEQEVEEEEDPIAQMIESMTVAEKIGQLLFVGIEGTTIDDATVEIIDRYKVGGIILFKRNIETIEQTRALLNELKERNRKNKVPLFLGIDEEGGRVSRLPKEFIPLPSLRKLAETHHEEEIFAIGRLQAKRVKSLGFNFNFAPVLDIHSNPQNEVIGDRSFGTEPDIVTSLGVKMMHGLKKAGVIPVVKHFPGHGDTLVDSHIDLPILDHPLSRLEEMELVPFKEAIKQGADVVMVAHLLLPALDSEYPSSLSEVIVTDLLRNQLRFEGVVITDDLVMGAITEMYGIGDAAVQAI